MLRVAASNLMEYVELNWGDDVMTVSWRMLRIRSPSISLSRLLMLKIFWIYSLSDLKKTWLCKTISLKYSTVCQLIFLNMLLFHSGTLHVSPGFFHLLAANSTQILDLLLNMTHEASSIFKVRLSDPIFKANASWEANNASFTNLKKNAILPSFPDIPTSQDDGSRAPRHWVDAAQLEHPHQHRPPPAEARLRIPFCNIIL